MPRGSQTDARTYGDETPQGRRARPTSTRYRGRAAGGTEAPAGAGLRRGCRLLRLCLQEIRDGRRGGTEHHTLPPHREGRRGVAGSDATPTGTSSGCRRACIGYMNGKSCDFAKRIDGRRHELRRRRRNRNRRCWWEGGWANTSVPFPQGTILTGRRGHKGRCGRRTLARPPFRLRLTFALFLFIFRERGRL